MSTSSHRRPVTSARVMPDSVSRHAAARRSRSLTARCMGVGAAPIKNLLQLLESTGAKVYSAGGPLQAIDAFSSRHRATPVIFLNVHKSAERLRFDLAHELGHLVMQRWFTTR
ncbi:ImmA/IrrE family metallo-endopeptidase [Micrococcus endophyticus]|uniref:ImmA/IrrE family metallo-endopeptidase n=1 Tax=Micrococcus endophyticus TaxID=455343 RepID=UPI0034CFA7DA